MATADEKELIAELADRVMTTGELAQLIARRAGETNVVTESFTLRDVKSGTPRVSYLTDRFAASDRRADSKIADSHDLGEESQDPDDF